MTLQPTTSSLPSKQEQAIEELTDDECRTIAMLLGSEYHYEPRYRHLGGKFITRLSRKQPKSLADAVVEYLDPVTLEVMGEANIDTHLDNVMRSHQ